jgi:hypothetical protein
LNPFQPPQTPAGKINVTDSRDVKTSRGWVQGYDAQAVCTEQQTVIAAEVTVDAQDFGHLESMVAVTWTRLEADRQSDMTEPIVCRGHIQASFEGAPCALAVPSAPIFGQAASLP